MAKFQFAHLMTVCSALLYIPSPQPKSFTQYEQPHFRFCSLGFRDHHRQTETPPSSRLFTTHNHPQRNAPNEIDFKTQAQAAATGLLVGVAVICFKASISLVQTTLYASSLIPIFAVPIIGGVAVSALSQFFNNGEQFKSTLNFAGSPNHKQILAKIFGAIATLGTTNSLGPEGPVVELGASISQLFCKEVNAKDSYLLLSAGSAAGISAGFNSPLAGCFFAIEIINNKPNSPNIATSRGLTVILIASIIATLVTQIGLKESLTLELLTGVDVLQNANVLFELPLYCGLGILSGIVSHAFNKLVSVLKISGFDKIPTRARPIVGATVVALISSFFPQVLFFGYSTLNSLIATGNSLNPSLLLEILVAKIFATATCVSCGLVGGMFAPAIFIGSILGTLFHSGLVTVFTSNDVGADVGYALSGAAAVLASLFQAPLTATILLFELTKEYEFILPTLASSSVASITSTLLLSKEKEREY